MTTKKKTAKKKPEKSKAPSNLEILAARSVRLIQLQDAKREIEAEIDRLLNPSEEDRAAIISMLPKGA